ncbi:MAG: hypothetical protein LAN63_19900 [Acidobacteriia bacterium]|nr:hypothetical protein [Terriglobia bacterium]
MAYKIECRTHGGSNASDILDLIENHTDRRFGRDGGTIICPTCKEPAAIPRCYELQEKGETWNGFFKQVVRIPSDIRTYVPYVVFTTGEEAGKVSDGIMVSYYKDTRDGKQGRLKHGHGPGGPAILGRSELLLLIRYLVEAGLVSAGEIRNVLSTFTR